MHYFKRNIGDYHKKAGRLSMLEHGAYTLLLDACYDREEFPTMEEALDWCWARSDDEEAAVRFVLSKFFTLENGRYVQNRVREEVEAYRALAAKNKEIAEKREAARRTKRDKESTKRGDNDTSGAPDHHEPPPNHKPLTTNHKPIVKTTTDTTEECAHDTPPSSVPAVPEIPDKPVPDETSNRAAQISVILRRNGGCHRTHASTKAVIELAASGATDTQILTALETAQKQRKDSGSAQPITAAYLVPIIAEQATEKPKKPAQQPRDEWWKSSHGIDRKARELGMFARATEDYHSFKDRIFDEIKKRESNGGTQP